MRRNKNWRWLAGTTAACVLVGALGIGGTIAYMTDNEATTNTFTVGKIDVDLTEPNYPGNDSPNVKNLVPNQELQKDPKVTNVGVNDAIVFMSVEVPVKDVTVVGADGTKGAKEKTELFWFKDTADTQGTYANHFSDQWMELTSKGEKDLATGDTNTYVFAYKTAVTKDAATDSLFDKIQLKNVIENEVTAGEVQNVVVNTYAIQASEVLEGNTDLTDALSEENLGKIYDIYFNQNPEKGGGSEEGPEVIENTTTLIDGSSFNASMSALAGDLNNIHSIKNTDTVPEDMKTQVVSTPGSEKEAVMYFDAESGTIYIATDAETINLNADASKMFQYCMGLVDLDALTNWNTENVTDMSNMFGSCGAISGSFTAAPLADWNTENVTDMSSMFMACSGLTNLDSLINWNTGNVLNMGGMFQGCSDLSDINGISVWNTWSVTDMNNMFNSCSITDLDAITGWDTGNVTNMSFMFYGCRKLQDASGINNWDIGNVTNFTGMFFDCSSYEHPTGLHPEFTKRPGTWDDDYGTFIPSV